MLSNEQSPDQIMHRLLVAIEKHCSDCLNYAVLKDCVLQSEAPPVEEVGDLLAHLQEVLDVCQHGHADFLHFLDVIAVKAHACFEIIHFLSYVWADCQADVCQSLSICDLEQVGKVFNQAPHRMLLLHQCLLLHQFFLHLLDMFDHIILALLSCAFLGMLQLVAFFDGLECVAFSHEDVLVVLANLFGEFSHRLLPDRKVLFGCFILPLTTFEHPWRQGLVRVLRLRSAHDR